MENKRLGNSDMHITPMGFGAWAIGGGNWEYAWGPQDDKESIFAIQRGLDLGMNWIDTAAVYGLGHSEEIVAKALKGMGGTKPYLFTKCSLVWDEQREINSSLKAASIRQELENSLRRLNVEAIDLYQIHWPDPEDEIEEGWATLSKLKEEGKIRYIGVSNFSVEQMQRVMQIAPITSLQPPYSLINRGIEAEILPFCEANNIGVINYSAMQSGLLTGAMTKERVDNFPEDDWRRRETDYQEPRLSRHLKLADLLEKIGKKHDKSAGEVAIAWTLRLSAITGAIVGFRRPSQVDGLIGAMEFRLTQDEITEIEAWLRAHP
jgi:aryl-alcohol dehydrogenase-like predicted oxidoreductase